MATVRAVNPQAARLAVDLDFVLRADMRSRFTTEFATVCATARDAAFAPAFTAGFALAFTALFAPAFTAGFAAALPPRLH
jgi:hypothetical protein